MYYTMRQAFLLWLRLHNEEWRIGGYIRIPNWFRWYIRKNTDWSYYVLDKKTEKWCDQMELDYNQRRRYKGCYRFKISNEELLNLERPEWIR